MALLEDLLATFGALIAAVVVSEILIFILDRVVKPLTAKTKTTLDDYLIEALHRPIRLFGIIVGIYLTLKPLYPMALFLERDVDFWAVTVLIAAAGYAVSKVLNGFLKWYTSEIGASGKRGLAVSGELFPIASKLVKIAVYSIALIIIFDRFGIEITPLVAALGIGGLAVALAVKDTLANFFAGVYLLSDKPVKVGEFIALEDQNSSVNGFVEEINWRTTRIRTRGNYTYFIPNEKVVSGALVNFSRGEGNNWKGYSLTVGVDYKADAGKVEKLLVEAVKKVQRSDKRMVQGDEPEARLEEFGESALVFKVLFRVNNYFEREAVAGEVRKQILTDLRKAKINIPFPIRTLELADKKKLTFS